MIIIRMNYNHEGKKEEAREEETTTPLVAIQITIYISLLLSSVTLVDCWCDMDKTGKDQYSCAFSNYYY